MIWLPRSTLSTPIHGHAFWEKFTCQGAWNASSSASTAKWIEGCLVAESGRFIVSTPRGRNVSTVQHDEARGTQRHSASNIPLDHVRAQSEGILCTDPIRDKRPASDISKFNTLATRCCCYSRDHQQPLRAEPPTSNPSSFQSRIVDQDSPDLRNVYTDTTHQCRGAVPSPTIGVAALKAFADQCTAQCSRSRMDIKSESHNE
ncbi:hypothetical protein DOTSEDRAFT_82894 [Dothistroma septosporum NZE10]|uniref:Uncharacterized protein n=1 Tax=Dothistroma septosporum (strain NZE10 / CBS 128990) TaxID=675120 RepID=N1PG56_DOTSN|nr:hypothetical protein DOTSEDRAFT_82894 [Dothistroma septosporum NZE10]